MLHSQCSLQEALSTLPLLSEQLPQLRPERHYIEPGKRSEMLHFSTHYTRTRICIREEKIIGPKQLWKVRDKNKWKQNVLLVRIWTSIMYVRVMSTNTIIHCIQWKVRYGKILHLPKTIFWGTLHPSSFLSKREHFQTQTFHHPTLSNLKRISWSEGESSNR